MFSKTLYKKTQSKYLISHPKRYFEMQKLNFYDKGLRNSVSGIKATVFGASGPLGALMGTTLTEKGSVCIYPYRNLAT